MGFGIRVAPGVRIRASSRGISAGLGPRAARVYVGSRGLGVGTGAGPFSAWTAAATWGGSPGGTHATSSGRAVATKSQLQAAERQLRAADREREVADAAAHERELTFAHTYPFPVAQRPTAAEPEPVDGAEIHNRLRSEAGIAAMEQAVGGGETPPVAPPPPEVDRFSIYRRHRLASTKGIPIWRLGDRRRAMESADEAAAAESVEEAKRLDAEAAAEQRRLDGLWEELEDVRASTETAAEAEIERVRLERQRDRDREQEQLDAEWGRLTENDPEAVMAALEEAFADNSAPAAPIGCIGSRVSIAMLFIHPEDLPERRADRTPTGKPTLKKRNKTEQNLFYRRVMASNVLATVRETFAVAPGVDEVRLVVLRQETNRSHRGDLAAVFAGAYARRHFDEAGWNDIDDPTREAEAESALINLKGRTNEVSALDLSDEPELAEVVAAINKGVDSSAGSIQPAG